jgi:hypothetical protein
MVRSQICPYKQGEEIPQIFRIEISPQTAKRINKLACIQISRRNNKNVLYPLTSKEGSSSPLENRQQI